MLPILKKQTLLAFPEDARLRDKFSCVFSLEVLRSIEGAEVRFIHMLYACMYASRFCTDTALTYAKYCYDMYGCVDVYLHVCMYVCMTGSAAVVL